MKFEVIPVLDTMLEIYSKPRSPDRFKEYLALLKGNTKNDLEIPITGFNPMAKDHVTDKIKELKNSRAEEIITDVISNINQKNNSKNGRTFKIFINVADDAKGGWTNRYTTDFDSKFKLNAYVERGFCIPYFWTSETYSQEIIIQRIKEYIYRTIYWAQNGRLRTLNDFVKQEQFVAKNTAISAKKNNSKALTLLDSYFNSNKNNEDYNLIFNFMYGDTVCESLSYPTFGISEHFTGFDFVKH